MVRLSANLGFLWTELPLPAAVRAAAAAGFDAVECHVPFYVDADLLVSALSETGLPMVGINTRSGNAQDGDRGLAAVPGRTAEARKHIDEAVDYTAAISAANVHVMSGVASGPEARRALVDNLRYAAMRAAPVGVGIVIEPINERDIPGYFLSEVEVASSIIDEVGADNVRILFDCYHVQIIQGDVLRRFEAHLPRIGHVQFASVPDRTEPGTGELDYPWLLEHLEDAGYDGYMGAEYRPTTSTERSLGWMSSLDRLRH